jgi:hypothetical protein
MDTAMDTAVATTKRCADALGASVTKKARVSSEIVHHRTAPHRSRTAPQPHRTAAQPQPQPHRSVAAAAPQRSRSRSVAAAQP